MTCDSRVSRRKFLMAAAGAGAAAALGVFKAAAVENPDSGNTPIKPDSAGIDMHNHVDVPLASGEGPGPDLDLAGEMKRSGLAAICMTFAVDYQPLTAPGQAYERFLNGLTATDAVLAKNRIRRVLTAKDLASAIEANESVVIQAVEGGHFLEGHVDRLELAHKRGLRLLGLLHDHDADPPLGDLYTAPAHLGGLTPLGADVIRECNRLGIVIDLTHASKDTVTSALKVSTKPILFSHTGLDTRLGNNPGMAQMMRQRLISPDHAKAIAEAEGVIGVWTHLADSVDDYVENIRAMVEAAGIDHVGIGTDTKLTPPNGGGGGRGQGPNGRSNGGVGAGPDNRSDGRSETKSGDRPDNGPDRSNDRSTSGPVSVTSAGTSQRPDERPGEKRFGGGGRNQNGGRTNTAWTDQKTGFYYAVTEAMKKHGFTSDEMAKIGSLNFRRVFDAATALRT